MRAAKTKALRDGLAEHYSQQVEQLIAESARTRDALISALRVNQTLTTSLQQTLDNFVEERVQWEAIVDGLEKIGEGLAARRQRKIRRTRK